MSDLLMLLIAAVFFLASLGLVFFFDWLTGR